MNFLKGLIVVGFLPTSQLECEGWLRDEEKWRCDYLLTQTLISIELRRWSRVERLSSSGSRVRRPPNFGTVIPFQCASSQVGPFYQTVVLKVPPLQSAPK